MTDPIESRNRPRGALPRRADLQAASSASRPAPVRAPLGMMALLIGTDEAVNRLLTEQLVGLGVAAAVHATSAPLALDPARPTPAIAIVDWPGSADQLRAIGRTLRSSPGGRDLLVLGLLPDLSTPAQAEALDAGCDEVLGRPIDPLLLDLRLAILVRQATDRLSLRLAERALGDRETAPAQTTAKPALADSLLHATLTGSMDAVYVLRALEGPAGAVSDFVYEDVNAPAERMMGHARSALVGRRVTEVAPLFRASELMEHCVQVYTAGRSIEQELPFPADVPAARWFRYQIVPYAEGVLIVSREITERKQAERALRRSTAEFRTLLDTIPHGIFMKDRQGRFIAVNRTMAVWLKARPEELIGRQWNLTFAASAKQEAKIAATDRDVMENGQPREYECDRDPEPDGSAKVLHVLKHPIRDEAGQVVGLVGFVQDITRRRQAEEQIQQSQALLQTVFDAIPHSVYAKDTDSRFIAVNKAVEDQWQLPAEVLLTQRFGNDEARPAEEIAVILRQDRQVMETGERLEEYMRVRTPTKGMRDFRTIKVPLRGPDGRIRGLAGISEDITERLNAEERLRQSQTLLQAVFDTIPHGVFVKNNQARFMMVNRTFAERWERDPDYFEGKSSPNPGADPDELREVDASDRQVLETGVPHSGVTQRTLPDGSRRPYHVTKSPLRNQRGEIVGLVGLAEDIAERVQAEKELRESRALLQTVFDTIPHPLFVKDLTGNFTMVNPALARIWNTDPDHIVGKRQLGPGSVEELGPVQAADRQVMETGEPYAGTIERTIPDGTQRFFQVVKVPLRDDLGTIKGLVGISEDITQRLQAERDLRRSQALLRAIFDTIPHDVFVKNNQRQYVMVNQTVSKRWGKPQEYFIGKSSPIENGNSEQMQRIEEIDRQVIEEGRPFSGIVERTLPNGEVRPFQVVKVPLRDENQNIAGLVALAEDIAERVKAESELRRSRALLQAVFDTIPHDLVVKDRERRLVMVNRSVVERWNQPIEAMLGTTSPGLNLRPEGDTRRAEETDLQVLEEGRPFFGILERTLPSGEVRPFHVVKVPLRDENHRIVGLVALAEDIAERVQAEAALKESQRLLQAVLDTLPESVYLKDREGRYTLVNKEFAARQQFPREQFTGQTVRALPTMTDPNVVKRIQEADRRVLETGELAELPEVRMQFPDGRVEWRRILKAPLRDASGAIVGVVSIAEDITERVRTEQALKASQRLLSTIIDSLPEAIFVKDRECRYQLVNARQAELYGLTPAEFIGRKSPELPLDPQHADWIRLTDREVLERGKVMEAPEMSMRLASGEEIWERIVKVPLRDETGAIVGLVGLRQDITARKKSEDERLALDRLLQRTQNLESLGAMAGGIAHDFNNLLQRILGYAELALLDVQDDTPARQSVQMIHDAGVAAVNLTRQMLTLSGRSRFTLEAVDLNQLADQAAPQMKTLLPAEVSLQVRHGADTPNVMADPPLLRQVLQSLVSNACEAMEGGGEIVMTTGAQRIDRDRLDESYSDRDLDNGLYGFLEVRDTGPGLPPDVQARLYEPFHSTKFFGRGLGLAAVRGIVRGHRGTIQTLAAPGTGAIFRILLPAATDGQAAAALSSESA